MKKLAIFAKVIEKDQLIYLEELVNIAQRCHFELCINQSLSEQAQQWSLDLSHIPTYNLESELGQFMPDYMVTLGGDGTFLDAATYVGDKGIPIVGINLGRLGFLAAVEKKFISEAIQMLDDKRYNQSERTLIQLGSNHQLFSEWPYAVNDMTLIKRDTSSMIIIHTFLDDEFLNSYWADGLIVSTPTGSTGYNMSCGGPILMNDSNSFILTPIAPHNLNVRPLVVPDTSRLKFSIEGRSDSFLCTLDSRFETIDSNTTITVQVAPFKIKVVSMENHSYLRTLREKLNWGKDTRNRYKRWK